MLAQQLGQLRNVCRDPPRFILAEQLGARSPPMMGPDKFSSQSF